MKQEIKSTEPNGGEEREEKEGNEMLEPIVGEKGEGTFTGMCTIKQLRSVIREDERERFGGRLHSLCLMIAMATRAHTHKADVYSAGVFLPKEDRLH